MLQLPLASVDSASWKLSSLKFGNISFFNKGIKGVFHKDILCGRRRFSQYQIETLHRLGISVEEFKNYDNHRGNRSIASYCNIYANLKMQKYCKERGLDFFLSISNHQDLKKIIYVATNKNKCYKDFKNIC